MNAVLLSDTPRPQHMKNVTTVHFNESRVSSIITFLLEKHCTILKDVFHLIL